MNPAFQRDLSAVFSTADFAIRALRASDGLCVTGIFDDSDFVGDDGYGREIIRRKAVLITRSTHDVKPDDVLTIECAEFIVRNTIDDGAGVVTLQLERK